MQGNAEILLISTDNKLILQQRDDKPNITNPGMTTAFGGGIEEGEDPLTAAWREIQEETNLKPAKQNLKFFKQYQKTKEIHGEDWDVYYHLLFDVKTKYLEVYEGQGFVVVENAEEAQKLYLSVLMQEVVADFFKTHPGLKETSN